MSWIVDSSVTRVQRFCMNVLKCGPVPRHVAFIMDGNRRYATKFNVAKSEGHAKGFEKLADTLQWCSELNIKEVTVYAFSIENFKRTPEEVETLMTLAEEKFERLLEERERIMAEGVCVRIVGNLSLLSAKLRSLIAQAVLMTRDNTKAFLNIAFAYTSRDEMAGAVKTVVEGVHEGRLEPEDISEELLTECLYTNDSANPDLLVRTSEIRLSDFLLWQVGDSQICFTEVLWPEFNIWHLLGAVFKYQRGLRYQRKPCGAAHLNSQRAEEFVAEVRRRRMAEMQSY